MAKKKLSKAEHARAVAAWKNCGMSHSGALQLVSEGKRAPKLAARKIVDRGG